jgi:hypothetical protein
METVSAWATTICTFFFLLVAVGSYAVFGGLSVRLCARAVVLACVLEARPPFAGAKFDGCLGRAAGGE